LGKKKVARAREGGYEGESENVIKWGSLLGAGKKSTEIRIKTYHNVSLLPGRFGRIFGRGENKREGYGEKRSQMEGGKAEFPPKGLRIASPGGVKRTNGGKPRVPKRN